MREIKFRAWDKILNKMVNVIEVNFRAHIIWNEVQTMHFEYIEIMQFTGIGDIDD